MLVGISGAQSTGKTSLIEALEKLPEFTERYNVYKGITRNVREHGFSINQNGNDMTQLLILNQHLVNGLLTNYVLDRCILDGLVYTVYLYKYEKRVSKWVMKYAYDLFDVLYPRYDKVIYIEPEVQLVEDGIRSVDQEFRTRIEELFEQVMTEKKCTDIVRIKGSVEERIEQVKSIIF